MDLILQQLPQQLINGFTMGGVYALIALGYTMVYGILLMLNFAHGEIYMIGGFVGWWVLFVLNKIGFALFNPFVTIFLMIVVSMVITGFLGVLIERFAYRPLRDAPRMNLLLSAFGMSIFLQNLVLKFQGAKVRFFNTSNLIPENLQSFQIGGLTLSYMRILVIVISIVIMLVLTWFVHKTKTGKAMRATSQDVEAASFMGIDTNKTIRMTFMIGSSIGGCAGVLVGLLFNQVDYYVGAVAGLKGFCAAVLGGIGSIPGAMLGGYLIGMVENLGVTLISSTYKDVIAFTILICVLIFKPQGLLGKKTPEKV
jgi:branched-chain amino acid transport system permease protein